MKNQILFLFIGLSAMSLCAQQSGYWQQKADYKMTVNMDVKNYQYTGKQTLIYHNDSKDTLKRVFYHLYSNAFQPGSEMDARIQTIKDPDGRMVSSKVVDGKTIKESRIKNLLPTEIGFLHVSNFKQNGVSATIKEVGTILEVILPKPLLPKSKTTFTLDFQGQVPVQIRRSGRNNAEGVELSMAQWYPKMVEFDHEGWHATPYIAREFHGVWGNFELKISIDQDYILGGTGYLLKPETIGYGYEKKGATVKRKPIDGKLTWHFIAPQVHDFTWAADKNYLHDTFEAENGVPLHFLYKNNPQFIDNWKKLQPLTAQLMSIYNKTVGQYPYKQYSVIQGGDGGMEYAMCTLILGNGKFDGLLGVTAHEMAHSWFQQILATNEGKHGWMDEGFTSFLEDYALNIVENKNVENPFEGAYRGYFAMVNGGKELPQTTHADRFDENRVYSISSYSKGELFLTQMIYLLGKDKVFATLKKYFNDYKFKHPTPNDIKRTAERISGANLDWYLIDWTQTTNTIDYGIKEVAEVALKTNITLERIGRMPMPIDLTVEYTDGTKEIFYIPLTMIHFEKENQTPDIKRTVLNDWAWAYPTYSFAINKPKSSIKKITIDESTLMADIKRENNVFEGK
jgi:hypothetical protein